MLGAHVIVYQQRAGEGARDKAEHEADSLRAIRRYLTGKLSCGGLRKGELYPLGHLASPSLATEVIERTEMTLVIMRIFIINRLETHKI